MHLSDASELLGQDNQLQHLRLELQSPSGTILTSGFSGNQNMLSTGEIAPGGRARGDVCFDNNQPAPGQYVVLYQPAFSFFSNRAAWVNSR